MFKNTWIGYNDRDFYSSKSSILSKLKYQLPEMTDQTDSNPFIKLVDIFCGVLEQTNYYIDRRAREVFFVTLQRFSSALKIANSYDYRVRGTNPASTDLRFYLTSGAAPSVITIPIGTEVRTKDGIPFFTTQAATIGIGDIDVIVPVIQKVQVTGVDIGVSDGTNFQRFELVENVVDGSVVVVVGVDNYTPIETLSEAQSTDKVFVAGLNENAKMSIEFGDDINGTLPPISQNITGSYYTSRGSAGNVAENTITEIISAISVPSGYTLQVTNVQRASGGVDSESTSDLKKRVPKSIRTNNRAITRQDFIDTAEIVNGVSKGAVNFDCGTTVSVYIVPVGGGAASTTLKRSVRNFFEKRRPVTLEVEVLSAGDVRILYEIDMIVLPNYNRADTVQLATDNLIEYMSEENQDIGGTVRLGDVYQVLENTEGVSSTEVRIMTVLPFAIPRGSEPDLIWSRSILEGSVSTAKWLLKIINSTQYQLYRNNNFLGIFDLETEYNLGDLVLNVEPGGYSAGDRWTFTTYRYFGTVSIQDLSIPTSQAENITIVATGGI